MSLKNLYTTTSADFSEDRVYRYALMREWGPGRVVNFIMLNPSTADELNNDPTVERCERRVRLMKPRCGKLVVTNIFALRSTDPSQLYSAVDPIGPDNDTYLRFAAERADLVVCGWGTHGAFGGRGKAVLDLLGKVGKVGKPLHCLRLTKDGIPGHPLYLPYSLQPVPIAV